LIQGTVSSKLEAVIRFSVRGPERVLETEAVVDTGFDGALTLPAELIARLGLRFKAESRAVLADGTEIAFDIYEGLILWGGRLLQLPVAAMGKNPLIGTELLHGSELVIQVIEGGKVAIYELPPS